MNSSFLPMLLLLLLPSNIFLHHRVVKAQQQSEQSSGLPDFPTESDTVSEFQPSLAVVVGVLAIMFTLTFTLLAYAKCCHNNHQNNRITSPRSIIHRLFAGHGESDHNRNGMIFNSPAPTLGRYSSGIDKTVIESLPFFRFSSLKGSKDGLECSVCLSRFEDVEVLRLLPKCKHGFHIDCIDRWLDNHSTCPLCRQKVSGDDLRLFRKGSTNSLRLDQSDRYVTPPPPVPVGDHQEVEEEEENNSFELFVEREEEEEEEGEASVSSSSTRFALGRSFRKLLFRGNNYREGDGEEEDELPNISGGARGTNSQGRQLLLPEEIDEEEERRMSMFHKFNHKIVVSDVVFKNRWSNVSSSDLLFLNSEMLNDLSSARFLSSAAKEGRGGDRGSMTSSNHQTNDHEITGMKYIKEEIERKRNLEAKVLCQITPQPSTSSTAASNYDHRILLTESEEKKMMKHKLVKNDQKRSMSEITGLDRFKKQGSRLNNNIDRAAGNNNAPGQERAGQEEEEKKRRRIWFPIARRTVQWFVNRENHRYRCYHHHDDQQQTHQFNNRTQALDV